MGRRGTTFLPAIKYLEEVTKPSLHKQDSTNPWFGPGSPRLGWTRLFLSTQYTNFETYLILKVGNSHNTVEDVEVFQTAHHPGCLSVSGQQNYSEQILFIITAHFKKVSGHCWRLKLVVGIWCHRFLFGDKFKCYFPLFLESGLLFMIYSSRSKLLSEFVSTE